MILTTQCHLGNFYYTLRKMEKLSVWFISFLKFYGSFFALVVVVILTSGHLGKVIDAQKKLLPVNLP